MEDGNVNEFLDSITRQDTAVLFRGKRYCFNPVSPTDEDPNYVLDIYIWSGRHDEDVTPVTAVSGASVSEYMEKFLKLPMWDGLTFWEAEKEMTWVDW